MAQNKKKKGKKSPLEKRARRDVKLANKYTLDELRKQGRQAKDTFKEGQAGVRDIYGRLGNELDTLSGQFSTQTAALPGQLTQQLGGLQSALGMTSGPSAEMQSGLGMMGSIGGSALGLLAGDQSRNLNYMTSAQRQAGIDETTMQKNFLEDYQDLINEIRQGRLDVKKDMGSQLLQRLDELRARKSENRIAKMLAGEQVKTSRFSRRETRRTNREADKARDAATDILTEEQKRRNLQRVLRQTNKRIGNVTDKLANTDEFGNPIPTPEGGFEIPENPKYERLTEKKQKLRKRKRRTKRKLRSL